MLREIGELWEARSKGLCLFRLVTKKTFKDCISGAASHK